MELKNKFWGFHGVFDCAAGDRTKVTDPDNIKSFTKALVERIDMEAYGDTWVAHFAEHSEVCAGYSMFQMITTSNIAAHFSDLTGDFYLDVFSCKPFEMDDVIAVIEEYFSPERIRPTFLIRQA